MNNLSIENFDYKFYSENNKDLKVLTENMTTNEKKTYLFTHFIKHGQNEKRMYRLNDNKNQIVLKDNYLKEIHELIKEFKRKIKKVELNNKNSKKDNKLKSKNKDKDDNKDKHDNKNKDDKDIINNIRVLNDDDANDVNDIDDLNDNDANDANDANDNDPNDNDDNN